MEAFLVKDMQDRHTLGRHSKSARAEL
jgi:hypothetical protein